MSQICRSLCYLILLVQVGFQIIICLQIILTQNKYIASIKSLTVGHSILQHVMTKIQELENMLQITRFNKLVPLVIKLRRSQNKSFKSLNHELDNFVHNSLVVERHKQPPSHAALEHNQDPYEMHQYISQNHQNQMEQSILVQKPTVASTLGNFFHIILSSQTLHFFQVNQLKGVAILENPSTNLL